MTNYIRRRQQRGVILLAIISLLTMFMLIGITYVVVSGHFKRAAVTNSRVRQLEVPPQKHLDGAMYQLLRDTDFAGSVVRGHSLLQDKYGHYAVQATVSNWGPFSNTKQILVVTIELPPGSVQNESELTGRVITFLDDSINISGHILHATKNVNIYKLQILVRDRSINISEVISRVRQQGRVVKILINGRDFSGTGFGLEPTNPARITIDALLPNRAADTKDEFTKFRRGGANEGYDVPDYQNMALAAQLSDPTTRQLQYVIPSFHRPALINYWEKRNATSERMDKVVMRPRRAEHPSFTGSNPTFNSIVGPWDVDNDGDGIRDSIWIDMGFPIQTDSSGRQYKPLFAVLCLDMDGRLNLNAHGNEMHHLANANSAAVIPRGMGYGPAEINLTNLFGPITNDYKQLLMGLGKTPGRYSQHYVLEDPSMPYDSVSNPYKWDGSPGNNPNYPPKFDYFTSYMFGHFPDNFVGTRNTSFQSIPDIHGELGYWIDSNVNNVVYQAPINPNTGRLIKLRTNAKVDNPYEANLVNPNATDQLFDAHEMEALLRYHDPDNPQFNNSSSFQPPFLTDGSSRLYQLTNTFSGNSNDASANRRSVTTASFDPPVPSIQIPKQSRTHHNYSGKSASFSQWLEAMLQSQVGGGINLKPIIRSLNLNPKLFSGLKMDVNQPFGDGIDNRVPGVVDFDGVVDNPAHPVPGEPYGNAYLNRHHYARNLYVLMLLIKEKNRRIDFNGDGNGTGNSVETRRNIAQWAVNAVDFRDADSIMTPFEFDLNPFDGWHVDGNVTTDESTWGSDKLDNNGDNQVDDAIEQAIAQAASRDRAVVWGTERPELLITESLAFHDRRTEDLDTAKTNNGVMDSFQNPILNNPPVPNPDGDFDQRLLPNSGVFFELYNPSTYGKQNTLLAGSKRPAEFYQDLKRNLEEGVRLDQLSYYSFKDIRLPPKNTKEDYRSPVWRMIIVRGKDKRRDPDAWDIANNPLTIERAIYFVDASNPNGTIKIPDEDNQNITERFFFAPKDNTERPKPLKPLQYAVIGSSGIYNKNEYTTYLGRHVNTVEGDNGAFNDQTNRIVLDPKNSQISRGHNPQLLTRDAVCIPINQHYKSDKTIEEKSLTITEPVFGYKIGNTNVTADGERFLVNTIDEPLDTKNPVNDIITGNSRRALTTSGTTSDFAVVHLQRLANPLHPFDKTINPYRTIDTASIDVTAFNGVNNTKDLMGMALEDNALFKEVERFDSHERGKQDAALVLNNKNNLWKQELPRANNGPAQNILIADHIFKYDFKATLGFWNDSYVKVAKGGHPFPWLQWNNRPFVSQLELMMVPRSSSSQLLKDYSFRKNTVTWNPYEVPNAATTNAAYGHLLNFFESDQNRASSNFHRLFDYTEVQSYFTGAQTYYKNSNILPTSAIRPDGLDPPFKRITNYRDPGRINLNTIFDRVVFEGLMNDHAGPNYVNWNHSRRAWLKPRDAQGNVIALGNTKDYYPTYFANPIRPAGSGDMVPPIEPLPVDYFKPDGTPMTTAEKVIHKAKFRALLERPDVEVSLLRSKLVNDQHSEKPLFSTGYTAPARNASRNPTFEYQSLQRLGNLTTGRSNVYSVWITVGYFEVTPKAIRKTFSPTAGLNDVNLTGYQLGAEVGIDDGRIKRHRAFYMIDRSIPVAFEPGENHNVDNAVILRRYID